MQIIIKTKDVELTEQLEALVNNKIGGLKKFMKSFEGHELPIPGGQNLFDVFVDIIRETNHHQKGNIFKTEARLYMPGKNLFVKAVAEDPAKSVLEVRDELESEIRKYKAKVIEFPVRKSKQFKNRH